MGGGRRERFYLSGTLEYEVEWKNGKYHGKREKLDDEGNTEYEGEWKKSMTMWDQTYNAADEVVSNAENLINCFKRSDNRDDCSHYVRQV